MSAVTPVMFSASAFFILPPDFVHLHGQICANIYTHCCVLVLKLINSSPRVGRFLHRNYAQIRMVRMLWRFVCIADEAPEG